MGNLTGVGLVVGNILISLVDFGDSLILMAGF